MFLCQKQGMPHSVETGVSASVIVVKGWAWWLAQIGGRIFIYCRFNFTGYMQNEILWRTRRQVRATYRDAVRVGVNRPNWTAIPVCLRHVF